MPGVPRGAAGVARRAMRDLETAMQQVREHDAHERRETAAHLRTAADELESMYGEMLIGFEGIAAAIESRELLRMVDAARAAVTRTAARLRTVAERV